MNWLKRLFQPAKPEPRPELEAIVSAIERATRESEIDPTETLCSLCLRDVKAYRTYGDGRVVCLACVFRNQA